MLPNKRMLIVALCVLLAACSSSSSKSGASLSREERAVLNLQMGARYLDMGMLNVAKEKLEKAYRLDPKNADIHNALAVFNERIKRHETARFHFEQAMTLSPENASIKNNYGRFLCENGSYQEGIALLDQALNMPLNNRKWFAQTNIGLCYTNHGEPVLAEQAFRSALQTKPEYAPALLQMQRISYQNRKYMSARGFLERYLAVAKHTAETLWIAIQTERALGNKMLTEQYRQQLLTLFPGSKQAQQIRTAINR